MLQSKKIHNCILFIILFFGIQIVHAQINTPAGATIPFGTNTTYPGSHIIPTNLPTGGVYGTAQDAADAYNQWKIDYVESCGGSPERFRVKFDNPSETVSEGIAYGMLLAAYAADKALFDGLWQYYQDNMNGNGVMNWKIGGCSGTIGSGGATDAELDAANALLVANIQWPNSSTPHDYAADATTLITSIKDYEIQPANQNGPYQTNNGDQWGFGNNCRNPSYQSPAYYKAYGDFVPSQSTLWDNAVTASYDLINANVHPTTGLVSNWSDHTGTPNTCNGPNEYGWDACRSAWRMGTDVSWYADPNAKTICNNMAAWIQNTGVANLKGPIPQNGIGGSYHSPTFISTWAVGVMGSNSTYQSTLNAIYDETVAVTDNLPYYFGNTLRAICLFNLTGNFWPPSNTMPAPQPPVVQFTNPTDGETFLINTPITIGADITDSDGTIASVQMDVDGTPISNTNTTGDSWEGTWTPTIVGTYTITITATDDTGLIATETITIIISDGSLPPNVVIMNPTNGATVTLNNVVNILATATDNDGTIVSVQMDIDGTPITMTNTSGDNWEANWTPTVVGTYTITVLVTDDSGLTATTSILVTVIDSSTNLPPSTHNYSEVLCKSFLFYEAQQAGILSPNNRITWRGESAMLDGNDVGEDLTGGWFDAGDHVKFGFPMAYSATMLAWSGVQDQAAYQTTAQWDALKESLRFVNDYFIKCHIRDANGNTDRFYGQVGNGSADHAWWGPAEVMQMARPSYYVDANNPGTDLTGETAAAMAAASMIFANDDPAYSAILLDHAIALYNFADNYRGKYSDAITDATAFYNSWSGYQDELVWGAIWLYRATGDPAYLTKAQTEYSFLNQQTGQNVPSYTWTIAWDDKAYGCYALMAQLTGQNQYMQDTERWLDFWTTGYNGNQVAYSPGGQAHLSTWGSLRYASNTAFVAMIYSDIIATSNPTKSELYRNFGITQINYALGDNPNNRSYVIGYGNNPPINPHHRTAHGSWANSIGVPIDNRHILYGALVGGPGAPDDQYVDDRGDYIANEVACDYNAGFTGAIARLINLYGGAPENMCFNIEVYDSCDEYYNEAKINASGSTFTEVAVWATNHSAWPATETEDVCYRYYIDISEGIAAGFTATDYIISLNVAPAGATASGLQLLSGTEYYVEVCFPGTNIYPGGQSESHKEAQLRIALPNNSPAAAWDPTNDWSYYTTAGSPMGSSLEINTRIPFFNNGQLLCGELPDGTVPNNNPEANITATPTSGNDPLLVNFDASASTDLDGDMLTYTWDFGDGTTGTGVTASHTYTTPGIYIVTLTVDDGNGGTDTETVTITVIDPTPQPPTAFFVSTSITGSYPLLVDFDGSGSADPNGDALTYAWDFGNGTTGTGVNSSQTFTTPGTYTVELTVSDGMFTDTYTVDITVVNDAPVADFTATPQNGQPPLLVNVDASATSDINGGALTYTWNFGDGTTATGITNNHTYNVEGTFTVTLTVTDEYGATDTTTTTITVSLSTCSLIIHYRTNDTNPSDNQVRPEFFVENIGTDPVDLSDVTFRYWFTKEGTATQQAHIDYAAVGAANITTNFVTMPVTTADADTYLEIGFTAGAGTLAPGTNTGNIQTRFHKTDWSNYDETNDYSFNMAHSTFTPWDHVTAYCNGILSYGIEPISTSNNCPDYMDVHDTGIVDDTYHAAIQVTSQGVVPNAGNVAFKAGTCIEMQAGFEVILGAVFEATIETCQ